MEDVLIGIGVAGIAICIIEWITLPFTLSNISKSLKELVEIERKKLNQK